MLHPVACHPGQIARDECVRAVVKRRILAEHARLLGRHGAYTGGVALERRPTVLVVDGNPDFLRAVQALDVPLAQLEGRELDGAVHEVG